MVRRPCSIIFLLRSSQSHFSGLHISTSSPKVSLSRWTTQALIPTIVPASNLFPYISAPLAGTTRSKGSPSGGWICPASFTHASRYGRSLAFFQVTGSESRFSLAASSSKAVEGFVDVLKDDRTRFAKGWQWCRYRQWCWVGCKRWPPSVISNFQAGEKVRILPIRDLWAFCFGFQETRQKSSTVPFLFLLILVSSLPHTPHYKSYPVIRTLWP